MTPIVVTLFILFSVLQLVDLVSTKIALEKGNTREADPIVAWFIKITNPSLGLIIAKSITVILGALIMAIGRGLDYLLLAVFATLDALYTYVVYHNLSIK